MMNFNQPNKQTNKQKLVVEYCYLAWYMLSLMCDFDDNRFEISQ